MTASEGSLVLKQELSAKTTVVRENPESSSQTNAPELLSIVIEQASSSNRTRASTSGNGEWFKSIANAESSSAPVQEVPPKISKVPDMLRNVEANKECYDPVVVAIGPYHHGKEHLQETEKLKMKWAKQFVESIPREGGAEQQGDDCLRLEKAIEKAYQEVEKEAERARKYYDREAWKGSDEEFARMMFVDGCFVVQFIHLRFRGGEEQSEIGGMRNHLVAFVHQDILLLENQLPYIVLEALMRKRFKDDQGKTMIKDFIDLTLQLPPTPTSFWHVNYFRSRSLTKATKTNNTPPPTDEPPADHLLHLLWKRFVNSAEFNRLCGKPEVRGRKPNDTEGVVGWYSYRSAKELKNVGIEFKPNTSGKFSDVGFASGFLLSGELTLPPLTVDDATKSMLLNLVALETCPGGPEGYCVASYICLMDSLLDNVEDVGVLRSHYVLMNYLGSDQQVADLFNDISKNLVPHPHAYRSVKARIEEHCNNKVKIWMAEWLNTHFTSPWTVLAFLGAVFAILLTGVQTYLAVKPPK